MPIAFTTISIERAAMVRNPALILLIEKIGEGGMGEVWVVKQTEPVKRKVAIKLIKAEMDSMAVLTCFEQERRALALIDHPNIAKVLDGGSWRLSGPGVDRGR